MSTLTSQDGGRLWLQQGYRKTKARRAHNGKTTGRLPKNYGSRARGGPTTILSKTIGGHTVDIFQNTESCGPKPDVPHRLSPIRPHARTRLLVPTAGGASLRHPAQNTHEGKLLLQVPWEMWGLHGACTGLVWCCRTVLMFPM